MEYDYCPHFIEGNQGREPWLNLHKALQISVCSISSSDPRKNPPRSPKQPQIHGWYIYPIIW